MRKDGVRGLYCGIVPEYAKARPLPMLHLQPCLSQLYAALLMELAVLIAR